MTTTMEPELEVKESVIDTEPSKYLKYLPAIYSDDPFIGRFLRIFEGISTPIEHMVENIHLYLDPRMAPTQMLPWLASWVDLVLDDQWPLEKRRQLIRSAVELYQWRGTRRGLREYLKIYTGVEPIIREHFGGIKLGQHSKLGWNTILGDGLDHCITVIIETENPAALKIDKVKAIIEAEKPAHVAYRLEIVAVDPADTLSFLLEGEDEE
jgi:phage tail-like protein